MDKKGRKIAKIAVVICVVVGASVYLLGHYKHKNIKSAKMSPTNNQKLVGLFVFL